MVDILRLAMSRSAFDLEECTADYIGRAVLDGLPDSVVASHSAPVSAPRQHSRSDPLSMPRANSLSSFLLDSTSLSFP